jgi:hypothetical protein
MWNEYAREKLDELERERSRAAAARPQAQYASTDAPSSAVPLRPVVRAAGSRVRRLGEAIERWAAPPQSGCEA